MLLAQEWDQDDQANIASLKFRISIVEFLF